MQYVEENRVSW